MSSSVEGEKRYSDYPAEVIRGPFNGFLHATRIIKTTPDSYSYTLDGTNYKPGTHIPDSGEFWVLPTDIIENLHHHLFLHYTNNKLDLFSYIRSHFIDVEGEFVGEREEIGTEGTLKDFVRQEEFMQLHKNGSATYIVGDTQYRFDRNPGTIRVALHVDSELVVQFPLSPDLDLVELNLPVSKI